MSREAYQTVQRTAAAAAAGTQNLYFHFPAPFMFEGFTWSYDTAEANADNTLDFVITYDSAGDGSFATTLHTNANAVGLLDSAAVGESLFNMGDAAGAGQAAVAATVTRTRIGAGSIRVAVTTAGTGTIPAITFGIVGKSLQPAV